MICAQSLRLLNLDEKLQDSNEIRYKIGWKIYYLNFVMKIIMGLNWIIESLIYFKRSIDQMLQTLFEQAIQARQG